MLHESLVVSPGPDGGSVRTADGRVLRVPAGWVLVPPGDPGLTRRIKAAGATWTVQERKGRKIFSRGVWTLRSSVEKIQKALEVERASPAYAKKREADARRRDREQTGYVEDFRGAVLRYLKFHARYSELAERLARAVTDHATPVRSGTVARTERIPLDERAEAAVIAWMRHRTTAYERMAVARAKGKRREVRRELAAQSKELLEGYRVGRDVDPGCPLWRALQV
jgi:hypothetical protein